MSFGSLGFMSTNEVHDMYIDIHIYKDTKDKSLIIMWTSSCLMPCDAFHNSSNGIKGSYVKFSTPAFSSTIVQTFISFYIKTVQDLK
jgi:hypothetical protein